MLHDRIGPYRILDVIGRGGMGVVYAAQRDDGTEAAVKTVRIANESTLESIRREIQTLRELSHPGVVAIRDHGVTEGLPWYAMDLLRGSTLRDHLSTWFPDATSSDAPTRERMKVDDTTKDLLRPARHAAAVVPSSPADAPAYSLEHIATLFRNICEPLAYVHGQGVVHRDLSPVNVFLTGADRPVLFDFGLAAQFRVDSARDVLEIGGTLRGTAHYMAPEQARGEVVDARADIYALGCMLYEALTGRPPFLGDSAVSVVMQHMDTPPIAPKYFVPTLPAAFDELVLRLLAKQPRHRLGYAQDVAAALERLGARGTSSPRLTPPRSYTYRPSLAGRTEEIRALDAHMRKLADGTGGCAVLLGEPGAGKTRLAAEIATLAGGHGARVITCECEPIGTANDELRGAPLHPLRPLLRAFADLCRDTGRNAIGPSVAVLAAYEPALAGLAPPLAEHIDPVAMRFRVLSVLRDVLVELTRGERLLVVIDDLQLADDLTLAFLQSLRGFLADAGIFILATVRVGELTSDITAAFDALAASWFEVPRLESRAIGSLIRDMLALDEDAPTLTEFVTQRSEGNPLFAAEYVRTAVDEGLLRRDLHGRWRVGTSDDESYDRLPTPGSLQELVVRRLQSLSPAARDMASAAATLGRTSPPELLAEVADQTGELARASINELIHRHVLEELLDAQLHFVHDKLREHAYAEQPETSRTRYHQRAATALEAHHRADADWALHLAQLAHHHEHAGQLAAAADYLEKAADHALSTAAFEQARNMLRHLIKLVPDAPAARRARWNRQLGEACFALGDLVGSAAHLGLSLDDLGQRAPSGKLGWSLRVASGVARQMWSRTIGRRQKHASDPTIGDAALASARMSSLYFFNDDSLGLIGSALTAANLAESAGYDVPIAEIYSQLGYVAGLAGLQGVANGYFAKARDIAESTRDPIGHGRALFSAAALHVGTGAWQQARTAAEQGLAIATEQRNPQEAEVGYTILGHVEFATGAYEASRRSAVQLYESAQARANLQHETWGVYTQARAALYLGELDAATSDFDRAMAMLEGSSDHASHILCGGMLASTLARAGDLPRARAMADETTKRIGSKRPPVFTIAEGFIGAADAYLELWRRGDDSVASAAKTAVANLARLSRVFPIASPAAHNLTGVYWLRRGARRRALASLRRGLAAAERLAMPYDRAIAHAALADAGQDGHRTRARALFTELGCRWHLDVSAPAD